VKCAGGKSKSSCALQRTCCSLRCSTVPTSRPLAEPNPIGTICAANSLSGRDHWLGGQSVGLPAYQCQWASCTTASGPCESRIVRFAPLLSTAHAGTRSASLQTAQRDCAAMLPTRCAARAARCFPRRPICIQQARALSTTAPSGAVAATSTEPSSSPKKRKPLTKEQREFLASAVRSPSPKA